MQAYRGRCVPEKELKMNNIRVFIAEDHKMVRAGLKSLIDSEQDMTVVGEADNGREAIDRVREITPDILMMDLSMPEVSGLVAAATLKRIVPSVKILTLTRHNDTAYLQELLQAGISGYVLKQSEAEEMLRAIRIVAAGDQYLDPAITRNFLGIVKAGKGVYPSRNETETLSERETDVLRRIALGYSNHQIADRLSTSVKTIESQKAAALRKLQIKGRSEIVDYAIMHGWLVKSP